MKKLLIILFAQILCSQAFAWRESNGGNGVSAEFRAISKQLLAAIDKVPALERLYTRKNFNLHLVEKDLTLEGQSVDAYTTNDSDSLNADIYLDQEKWEKRSADQKKYLVLHELTHFMVIKDENYSISQYALEKIDIYKRLQEKYYYSTFPIDLEIISSIEGCDLDSFVVVYSLVADLDYTVRGEDKTITQLIARSRCESIQAYNPGQHEVSVK